jgi:hypothetical protein
VPTAYVTPHIAGGVDCRFVRLRDANLTHVQCFTAKAADPPLRGCPGKRAVSEEVPMDIPESGVTLLNGQ